MTSCAWCGEDIFEAGHSELFDIGKESVYLCHDCRTKVESNIDEGKGKYIVDKCRTCGHVRGLIFRKYKPRGRKKGSQNKPKPRPEGGGLEKFTK